MPIGAFCQNIKIEYSKSLDSGMEESSGLVRATDTSLFTINDSGNEPYLFEINLKGKLIRKIRIKAKNTDWEDLAIDEDGDLFIGDFGNNRNSRKDLKILRIYKRQLSDSVIKPTVYHLSYPDQKAFPPEKSGLYFDCEAFIVKGRYAYLFTKNRTEPFDGLSKIYRIDLDAGKTNIQSLGAIQLCKQGWYPCSVTSASYNHSTKELLLLSYSKVLRFRDFSFSQKSFRMCEEYSIGRLEQFEAISHFGNSFFLSSEKQKIIGGNKLHKAKIKN